MDGIGEQGLFIIAALVIAFINWLSGTLKKRKSAQHDSDEHIHGNHREASEETLSHADHDSWPAPDDEQDLPVADLQQGTNDPNREIREFFSALSGTSPVEAPPVTVIEEKLPVQPPPIPEPATIPKSQSSEAYYIAPHDADSSRKKRIHPIIQKLLKEGGARDAFIFTQILGKPKALGENR